MTFLSAYLESALKQFVYLKWLADKNELEALAKLIPIVSSEKVAHFLWSSTRNPNPHAHTILCAVQWTPDDSATPNHGKTHAPTRFILYPLAFILRKFLSLLCFAAIPRLLHCPLSLSLLSFKKFRSVRYFPVRYFP